MTDTKLSEEKYYIYSVAEGTVVVHETAIEMLRWVTMVSGGKYIIIKGEQIGEVTIQSKEAKNDNDK